MLRMIFVTGLVSVACLSAAGAQAQAQARDPEQVVSVHGMDFNDPSQVVKVYVRLKAASEYVCDGRLFVDNSAGASDILCAREVLSYTIKTMNQPEVTRLHRLPMKEREAQLAQVESMLKVHR